MRFTFLCGVVVLVLLCCFTSGCVASSSPNDLASIHERRWRTSQYVHRVSAVLLALTGDASVADVFDHDDNGLHGRVVAPVLSAFGKSHDGVHTYVSAATFVGNVTRYAAVVLRDKLYLVSRLMSVVVGAELSVSEEQKLQRWMGRSSCVRTSDMSCRNNNVRAANYALTSGRVAANVSDVFRDLRHVAASFAPPQSTVAHAGTTSNASLATADATRIAAQGDERVAHELAFVRLSDFSDFVAQVQKSCRDTGGYAAFRDDVQLFCRLNVDEPHYEKVSVYNYFKNMGPSMYTNCSLVGGFSVPLVRCLCPQSATESLSRLSATCVYREVDVRVVVNDALRCTFANGKVPASAPAAALLGNDYCLTSRRDDTVQVPFEVTMKFAPATFAASRVANADDDSVGRYNDDDTSGYITQIDTDILDGTFEELRTRVSSRFAVCWSNYWSTNPEAVNELSVGHDATRYKIGLLPIAFDAPELTLSHMILLPLMTCPSPDKPTDVQQHEQHSATIDGVTANVQSIPVNLATYRDAFVRYKHMYFEFGLVRDIKNYNMSVSRIYITLSDFVAPAATYHYGGKVDRMYYVLIAVAVLIAAGIAAQLLWRCFVHSGDLEDKLVSYATHVAKTREQQVCAGAAHSSHK